MVERDLDDFHRRGGAEITKRSSEIDPVEAKDGVDILQSFDAVRRDRARRSDVKRVVGRKSAAILKSGATRPINCFRNGKPGTQAGCVARGRAASINTCFAP